MLSKEKTEQLNWQEASDDINADITFENPTG
jgi:hypothetical protein